MGGGAGPSLADDGPIFLIRLWTYFIPLSVLSSEGKGVDLPARRWARGSGLRGCPRQLLSCFLPPPSPGGLQSRGWERGAQGGQEG